MERDSNQIEILSEEYYCDQVLYWAPDSRKLYVNGLKGLSERVVCVDTVSKSTEEVVRLDWADLAFGYQPRWANASNPLEGSEQPFRRLCGVN